MAFKWHCISDTCNESDCTITYNFGDGDVYQTSGGSTSSHIFLQADTFTVWLTAVCECNVDSTSQQIIVIPAPSVAPHVSNPVCSTDTTSFASQTLIGNPVFFEWWFGDGSFDAGRADTIHCYASPGTYQGWLVARGLNGCPSDTARFTAMALPLPSVMFTGDTAVCQFAQLKIAVDTPIANATYIWDVIGPRDTELVTPNFSSFMFNTADTGTFTISLEAFANATPQCTAYSGTNEVTVLQSPLANFTISPVRTTVNADVNFLNTSIHALSYWWNFGVDTVSVYETNPVYQYPTPGIYPVMLTAVNGFCRDTLIKSVIIDPVLNLFIPNVITANNDGNNDYFQLYGHLEAITTFDIKIFDRIGEKVFESSNVNFKWSGTYDEKNVGPAVFVYEMHMGILGGNPGETKTYKGSVTVLR